MAHLSRVVSLKSDIPKHTHIHTYVAARNNARGGDVACNVSTILLSVQFRRTSTFLI